MDLEPPRRVRGPRDGGPDDEDLVVDVDDELPPDGEVGPHGEDLALQRWLAEREQARKLLEERTGRKVQVMEYSPGEGRRRVPWLRLAAMALVLVVAIAALYAFAIPRADAELVIQYNEGVMGGINVDARIENHGTRDMTDVRVTILVQNSTDVRMAEPAVFEGVVAAHDQAGLEAISFSGDQWDTYHVFVEWSFECAGERYAGSEHYDTRDDAMNIWFTEDMTG